ncbi:multidrug resistance-associated protein 4-like [Nasonia vitripennis]|uniref:Uncharacterized protein n=1 Tax=Nasonia vitripennis TaxID=7425 RepID=A0A7M7QW53_NASVI|nr:multidrug resistance-associated protein 4-like [Nasonia vitripennis]
MSQVLRWLKDLLLHGYKHGIEADDLYDVLPQHRSELLCDSLEKVWSEELKNAESQGRKPSLWKIIFKTYGLSYLKYSMLSVCYIVSTLLMPLMLEQLLLNIDTSWSYVYAAGLLFLQIGPLIGSRYSFSKILQVCAQESLLHLSCTER